MSSPLGSVVRGLAAGILGSAAQDVFFALTSRIAPKPPEGVFVPPEPEQLEESAPETVARRAAALLQRPLPVDKARAGHAVHYAFGGAWGAAYGATAATFPKASGPIGGAAFGMLVWVASNDLLLPAFKLAAWPTHYPVRSHLYAIAAHLAYGAVMGAALDKLTPKKPAANLIVHASERPPEPVHMRTHAPDMLEAGAGI
ncbi:DUF6789 family protein [Sandaracinus amylolyticus]|uniref:DUF1440 domain-containing protein n=1 Tax=Sandaracinus amylolyticus TaxID=927083 RepID=A0A0F6YL17_9BACT|nr:DUF6789 family protein [Sandaracinus amylolyticus]AKF08807.1 hypothetical protein DB32_005956 [Sandaracinus amylolyticus]